MSRDALHVDSCLACDLAAGRVPLPGGRIHSTGHWIVEHCIGRLPLGTLIVKPVRHVTCVAELSDNEVAELGPLLRLASAVARELVRADQVYNCLWSHAGGRPVHVHYVVQPVTRQDVERLGTYGPSLQVALFDHGRAPAATQIEQLAERARVLFA